MRRADRDKELYRKRIRRRRLVDEVEKSVQAKDRKHQSQQIARNDGNNLHVSSPLDRLRMGLHGLKMRSKKRIPVLPVVERRGSTCCEESRVCHTEEAKDRPQIGLDKVERGHLRLRIIDPAGRDEERRLFAREQSFRRSIRIGKNLAHARNLVDPELQHRGHTEVMHWHAEYVLICLLQFGDQRVRKRQHFLLWRSARLLRRVGSTHPFGGDRRDRGCVKVAVEDRSFRVRRLPLSNERIGKLTRDGSPIQRAGVDMKKRGHNDKTSYATIDV